MQTWIAALLVQLTDVSAGFYVAVGVLAGLVAAVVIVGIVPYRKVTGTMSAYEPRFPRPAGG